MFRDLLDFFRENQYYIEADISTFKSSCCRCHIPVLDLNEIKKKICKITCANQPKSVTGLKFSLSNELFFIHTENHYLISARIELRDLSNELANGDIQLKILGTIEILSIMLNHHNISPDFQTFFERSNRGKIKTMILIEMDDRDYNLLRLSNLENLNIRTDDRVIGKVLLYPCDMFANRFNEV